MKYITGLIFLLSFFSTYANKPFSTWQIDIRKQIQFGKEECQYIIDNDNFKKDKNYNYTDIFTDENGKIQLSFDVYYNKIVIRDSTDTIVLEQLFDNQEIKTHLKSILLPFYSKKICYFAYISTKDNEKYGTLNYIKIDYNSTPNIISAETLIAPSITSLPLAATLSQDGESYFMASMVADPEELLITQLFSSGNYVNTRNKDTDLKNENNITSGKKLKFSPQGDKLILNYYGSNFVFYSFDKSNGDITQNFKVDFNKESEYNIRSMFEFSQDGSKLYTQSGHDNYIIHQFDLSDYSNKNSFLNSMKIIWSQKASCVDCLFREFQLAPNNRIYISYLFSFTGRKDSTFLGVINCPNSEAPFVGYQHLGLDVSDNIINIPNIQNIPSNFLAIPQTPTVFKPFDEVIQYCISTNDTLKGIDDACGEQMWIKNDGTKVYSKDLIFENIKAEDAGLYFYHFQNCYQVFNDTFAIKIIDKIDPQIVKVSPDKLDLCQNPFEEITFTSKEKYKVYKWYFTKSGTSNRVQIGDQDTIRISELGLLEMEVVDEGSCEGLASYSIEKVQIEFPQIEEYEIRICRGIEQSYSIDFPLKSNKSLTVDSLALRLGDKMSISNKSFLIDTYPNGEFKRNIIIDFDRLSEGIIYDTLDIFVDSECKRKISLPLKIIIENTKFVLEAPHLRTTIGEKDFEIPIYLTTTCLEPTDDFNFEATIVLSKDKFYLNRVDGVNLINTFTVNKMQNIHISYDGSSLSNNGRIQIGSLFGTVLLSDNDSTGIFFTDTASYYVFDLLDGSLVTENICFQNLRQVFFFDNSLDVSIAGNLITIKSNDSYRGNINIKILNYIGQNINEFNINKNEDKIEKNMQLVGNSTGLYFLLISEGNYSEIKKIFIE